MTLGNRFSGSSIPEATFQDTTGPLLTHIGANLPRNGAFLGRTRAFLGRTRAFLGRNGAFLVWFGSELCGNETVAAFPGPQTVPGSRPVGGAKSYCVEQRANEASPDAWTLATTSTKAKATVKGLVSGRKYWFRVAAIGSAGQGAWSETVGMVAG